MSGHGGHHRHHDADFDWDAMADALEVDGALVLPLVASVVAGLGAIGVDTAAVAHVVDVGCGPGVVTCALARHLPSTAVTGLDSAPQLLDRLRRRAAEEGLAERVSAVEADLEDELPALAPAHLVWASMVVHHVADPLATLRRLGGLLRPGGTLVLVEFAGHPRVLPDDDPLVAHGTWQRLEEAALASLARRLGPDVIGRDWPADLSRAGLTDATDRIVTFSHDAPLEEIGRRWLVRHVRRGIGMAADALPADDAAALEAFALAVETGERTDAFVVAERRVLTARRPG
jgi:SAM-dependent methyltransferase